MLRFFRDLFFVCFEDGLHVLFEERHQIPVMIAAKKRLRIENHGLFRLRRARGPCGKSGMVRSARSGKGNDGIENQAFQLTGTVLLCGRYELCIVEHIRNVRAVPGRGASVNGHVMVEQIGPGAVVQRAAQADILLRSRAEEMIQPDGVAERMLRPGLLKQRDQLRGMLFSEDRFHQPELLSFTC